MATQSQSFTRSPLGFLSILDHRRRYQAAGPRDLRLDMLRGFCLFAMIVDHIAGPSWLHAITGGNRFYVSAAEGFVFISGLLLGSIYRKTIAKAGFEAVARKAIQRAGKLYILMAVLTLTAGLTMFAWRGQWWADLAGLGTPVEFIRNVLMLRRSFFLTDILVLYTLLIAGAPFAIWLLHNEKWWLLLAGSWAWWLAYQLAPGIASQPLPGIASFHPAAWQIFFVHAMVLGYHRERVARALGPQRRRAIFIAAGVLLSIMLLVYQSQGALIDMVVPGNSQELLTRITLKDHVGPGRILAATATFPVAYLLATYLWEPLH